MKGIDVSYVQGSINWQKVAESDVKFAMIKATQGRGEGVASRLVRNFTDVQFKKNITNAAAAGIPIGVYHYMTAQTIAEAENEAKYFCDTIEPYKNKITLWAVVDVESGMYLDKLDRNSLTAIVRHFLNYVKKRGFKPMLYTNPNYLCYRYTPGAFDDTDIWLAHWSVKSPMNVPNLKIWQYCATGTKSDVTKKYATVAEGRIPGINAACDVNTGYFEITPTPVYAKGDKYTIKKGDYYTNGVAVPKILIGRKYTISAVREGKILLKEINSWVRV